MDAVAELRRTIVEAFAPNAYPGDAYLVNSHQGDEPEEEAGAFRGRTDWRALEAGFLDDHPGALHYFTQAALRFYLPAFLLADLEPGLERADPLFTLTHGFADASVDVRVGERTFRQSTGRSTLVNPTLYGALTSHDHARYRLAAFCREEAGAIVAYLRHRAAIDDLGLDARAVEAALTGFWLGRAGDAPTRAALEGHLRERQAFVDALQRDRQGGDGAP